jgi:hypothetical protein
MRQSSASAAWVSCSLSLEPEPERIRLQRVVTNVPRLTVPWFALAELKTGDFSEISLVEQGQITAMRLSLNAVRLFIIKRGSARNLVCQITTGSGASRLQSVRYRVGAPARHHGGQGDQV